MEERNWWDCDDGDTQQETLSVPMTLGRQENLFDESGQPAFVPPTSTIFEEEAGPAAMTLPKTDVSVHRRSKTTARVVATTRPARVTRVMSVARTEKASAGGMARHLAMSQSISSGSEETRWFSVPQRVLLPRYQLFTGGDSVREERGGLRIVSSSSASSHGRVWFV